MQEHSQGGLAAAPGPGTTGWPNADQAAAAPVAPEPGTAPPEASREPSGGADPAARTWSGPARGSLLWNP